MAVELNPLRQLYKDFLTILDKCVIKYKSVADSYETLESKKKADEYIKAYLKEDKFETYYRYDIEVLAYAIGIADEDQLEHYHYNRNDIPFEYRDAILRKQREVIISKYVETNNYYRCYNGLPDYEDTDFIYVEPSIMINYDVDGSKPIHEMSDIDISVLDSIGYIDVLIKRYPNKKYLRYLGQHKIDIVTSRRARNFSLMSIPYGISEPMWNMFSFIYEQCREYFMTCIYIIEYRQTIDFYDNFIALCIMIMTIQQILARVIKSTIERDFFDENCIRILFDVYNVPYHASMDSNTRRQIMQSLNLLIQNKGTNKVIYDIASLLGYDRIKVFKYYLVKSQKFDLNGLPIVEYKKDEITGEDVLDYEKMFSVYFQRVSIEDLDAYKSMLDVTNKASFEEITLNDPYWVDDAELERELYESEYNFVETKYMGVNISFRLTKILFENIYLLKMIFEKRNELSSITMELPRLSPNSEVTLFDAVVILCALTCRQNNLKGEILTKPSMILHVLGFNFNEDFKAIQDDILSNPYLDDSLIEYFRDSTCYSSEKLNLLYTNFLNLYDVLIEKMSSTDNIHVYQAYKKLYDTLFYSEENQKMFNIGTLAEPVYATTFLEYVKVRLPDYYDAIVETNKEQLHVLSNHVCSKIEAIIPNLKYLGIFSDTSSTVETMLIDLIRFFKSYTTDLLGLDVLYIYDMKAENILKLIDTIHIKKTISTNDSLNISYSDTLTHSSKVVANSKLDLVDKIYYISVFMNIFEKYKFSDIISHINTNIALEDSGVTYYDVLNHITKEISLYSRTTFKDLYELIVTLHLSSNLSFNECISIVSDFMLTENLSISDMLTILKKCIEIKDSILLSSGENDKYTINVKVNISDYQRFIDMILSVSSKEILDEIFIFKELINISSLIKIKTGMSLIDDHNRTIILSVKDIVLKLKEVVSVLTNTNIEVDMGFFDVNDVDKVSECSESLKLRETYKISFI